MKILFLSDNFPPEVNAPARRTYEHCLEWVKKGDDVTIITCFPNYPKGKIFKGYRNTLYKRENVEGIKVIRVWSFIAANEGIFKRSIDHISYAFMAIAASLFVRRPDVIIATTPQFFTAIAGRITSFIRGRPWIMEVRDIWPESIEALGVIKRNKFYSFLERIELALYRSARNIIVVTDSFKDNLVDRNIAAEKIKIIKNGVDQSIFQVQAFNDKVYGPELKNKFKIGYIGTHGMAHNLEFILECALELKNESNVHFIFIGDGAQKASLVLWARKQNLNNVSFYNSIPKTQVPEYISGLNVALIPLKNSRVFESVLPSKIFENAAMGIPILLGVKGEAKELIKKYNAGLAYEPENKEDFIKKTLNIYRSVELQQSLSKGGLLLAKDFDRLMLANKMRKVILDASN